MRRLLAGTIIAATLIAASATASAAKPSGAGGKGGGRAASSSLALVLLGSADAVPDHGERITFEVSTSATRPFVALTCYQNGALVGAGSVGYFEGYPWAQEFTLASTTWSGGAADCNARLYSSKDGTRTTTLATLSFHVDG